MGSEHHRVVGAKSQVRGGRVGRGIAVAAVLAGAMVGAAARGDDAAEFDPWRSLRKGDWVTLQARQSETMVVEQTWRVLSADDQKVVYQIESVTLVEGKQFGKKTASSRETVLLRGEGAKPGPAEQAAAGARSIKRLRKKLDIAKRLLDCEILELTTEVAGEKVITRIFTCSEVPFGIVRIENGDQVTQELVAFGRGEE